MENRDKIRESRIKFGYLLLLVICVLIVGPIKGTAQETGKIKTEEYSALLNQREVDKNNVSKEGDLISLKFNDLGLSEALKMLAGELNVGLAFDAGLTLNKKITTQLQEVTAYEALNSILAGTGLEAEISESREVIFIKESKERDLLLEMITGTVTDAQSGETLPGVNILVKGTTTGASTDAEGSFELEVPTLQDTLVVSFVGYQTREVPIGGRTELDIQLTPEAIVGEEMVVVGYGTMQKSSVTSSISKIENESLNEIPESRPENALAGRLAGVSVVNPRNTPGAAPNIRIRGVGSIDAGNDPLVVIDGYPGGNLGQLNMNDVESIEVLKDPSSAAIYGSRGAGGVILVTTKRGSSSDVQVNYNGYFGISDPMLHGDWLTGEEWYEYLAKYQNREFAWAGGDTDLPMYGDDRRPPEYQVNPLTYELPQTVWEEEITQIAPIQSHSLSLGGGTDNIRYFVSGNFVEEEGTIKTTFYRQFSLRGNLDVEVNDKLNVGININPSFGKRRIPARLMNSLSKYPPFVPPAHEDVDYPPRTQDFITSGHSGQANPYTYLYGTEHFNETFRNQGQIFAAFEPIEGLMFKSSIGTNITFNYTDIFRGTLGDPSLSTRGSDARSRGINLINENTLNYTTTFREVHGIDLLLGASYQQQNNTSNSIQAESGTFNNEIIHTLNNAIIDPSGTTASKTDWGLVSYFSRINYDYKEKYLLSAAFRMDGSSRFGPENKWGNFPSLSVAWRVTEEEFMQEFTALDELKFRASYGVTGNNNIGNYTYLGTIGTTVYSPDNIYAQGQVQSSFENPRLSWERTTGMDVGVDLNLFNNRFNITFDYYDNKTADLLYRINIPALTGFTSTVSNIGEVRNYGAELELLTRNIVGSFNWQTSFNVSRNYNEVLDLGDDVEERIIPHHQRGISWILREGESMFSYYGYKMQGVYQDEEEIANSPSLPGTVPGNPIIADRNGDGIIDGDDKEILGNFQPRYLLGMVNDFSWNNFDLSIAMQISLGAEMYNEENQFYQGNTLGAMRESLVENQWWSPEEPGDGMTPAAAQSQLGVNTATDFYIENASYLSVRNLNFGYTLPIDIAHTLGISGIRIYTSMNNLLMITSSENHSYNPEGFTSGEISGINSYPGFNRGAEPVNRVYTIGLNVDF